MGIVILDPLDLVIALMDDFLQSPGPVLPGEAHFVPGLLCHHRPLALEISVFPCCVSLGIKRPML
jgi:hypothetical protein